MFDGYCETCDAVSIYGPRRIVKMDNGPEAIRVAFRCWCGTVGVRIFDDGPVRPLTHERAC